MRKPGFYIAKAVLVMMLLVGSEWSPHIRAQASTDNPYEVVIRLSDDFKRSGNTDDLVSLAGLVHSERFGPDAAGALKLVARWVTRHEAQSIVIPALAGGLRTTNIAIRREAAIALRDYSPYIAPVIPALVDFLDSSQEADKINGDYCVIEALGRLGHEASPAIPTLLKIVNWPDKYLDRFGSISPRTAAAAAIGQIGFSDSATRLGLEKVLSDREPHVRVAAASALIDNRFMSEAALATLSQTIVTNDITYSLKPATLQFIRDAATNANPSIKEAAVFLLKKLKKE